MKNRRKVVTLKKASLKRKQLAKQRVELKQKLKEDKTPPQYYHYHQNNSGGRWHKPALNVIIQANSPEEADVIAGQYGVYFDSEYEHDCSCCGTRWDKANEYDGSKKPEHYGRSITDPKNFHDNMTNAWAEEAQIPIFLIVHLDGKVEMLPKKISPSDQLKFELERRPIKIRKKI